jgi:hypothetical protein
MLLRTLRITALLAVFTATAFADASHDHMMAHEPKMSFIDNGVIRLGADLNLGGAITWLSRSGSDQNLVNSWDFGRQIQMSYYSGPVPFAVGDKQPLPHWAGLGWNPIQVGDAFGNASRIRKHTNDGKTLYVKCVPMHWPLDNVPGECTFECWFDLDGPAVHARCRLVNDRPDHTQYPARGQELPAVYTNGPWYRLMTYAGDKPFTNDALTRIEKKQGEPGPWSHWAATESWAALVDDDDFGLGIYSPVRCHFTGGFAGKPGKGGAHDDPTGYIAPNATEILDWNVTHEYRYDLILGNLPDIRAYVYAHAPKPTPPSYRFEHDREGWWYHNATDAGWPLRGGELNVLMEHDDPQLVGPVQFWRAQDAGTLVIEAACHSARNDARLFWRRLSDAGFGEQNSLGFPLIPDGQYHTYRVKLADQPTWTGGLLQLRLDPVGSGAPGEWFRVKSIRLEK